MNILKIENVTKQFVGHRALDNVSLTVPENSIYGLLGPNGAGKTTLIRIINHITAPDSGTVEYKGHPLRQEDVARMGYLPEERGLYKKMKVGEQALFFARLKGMSKADAQRELKIWFEKFDIADWWNKKVEELSKGMAQKVQFIVTVLHNPELLIFDEPFSGFDPINAKLLTDEILELHRKGATIIFSTHNMASVEALCSEITLINRAHNILSGRVDNIRKSFGANRYNFSFKGEHEVLLNLFGDRIEEIISSTREGDESKIVMKFRPDVSFRSLIGLANENLELTAFSADLPSMDEIFIRTVENSNNSLENE